MNRKGFSLIELMIVVSIIGILAAIAIPQFAHMVGMSQVNTKREKQGLPELTSEQYDKMYPRGPDRPPVDLDNNVSTTNSYSSDHVDHIRSLQVQCSGKSVGGQTLIDMNSCHVLTEN